MRSTRYRGRRRGGNFLISLNFSRWRSFMKTKLISVAVSVACATVVLSIASPVFAQSTAKEAASAVTRAQVKAERDEFLKTHEWVGDEWRLKLKKGEKAPAPSGKTRAEIKAERDAFLKDNRWDSAAEAWVSIKATPRDVSKLTREQVKSEAAEFNRTHIWDEGSMKYVPRGRPLPAK